MCLQRKVLHPSQTPIERINALGTNSFNTSLTQLPFLQLTGFLGANPCKKVEIVAQLWHSCNLQELGGGADLFVT